MTVAESVRQSPEQELRSRGYASRNGYAVTKDGLGADVDSGPLRAMIEGYLLSIGCEKYTLTEEGYPGRGGEVVWSHPSGGGRNRPLADVIAWQMQQEANVAYEAPKGWPNNGATNRDNDRMARKRALEAAVEEAVR